MPSFMRSPSPCRLSSPQGAAMTRAEGKGQRLFAPPASPLPCRPPWVVVEGLRPLPSAFYHVLSPPSTEKIGVCCSSVLSRPYLPCSPSLWRVVHAMSCFFPKTSYESC